MAERPKRTPPPVPPGAGSKRKAPPLPLEVRRRKSRAASRKKKGKGRAKGWINYFWWLATGPFRFVFKHAFLLSILALGLILPVCVIYGVRAMKVDLDLVHEMPKASIVYDKDGQQLGRFFEQNRVPLPPGKLPEKLTQAIIATEDQRFYYHPGIDVAGIARAALANVLPGGLREGGSTITQQLARNSINRMERTYDRKLLEIFLALRIEATYSKDEILRNYFDRIYYGHGLYGAQTAAQAFFGKSVHDLSLGEAALLAGMVSAPNTFSPWSGKTKAAFEKTLAVRDKSLRRMQRHGFATEEEVEQAKAEPFVLKPRPSFGGNYAIEEVRRQLRGLVPPQELKAGGLKIFTTVDYGLQYLAGQVIQEHLATLENTKAYRSRHGRKGAGQLQAAFFALSPENGAIRAVVGGRDYNESPFNRATQAKRQVGSTLKPLLYGAAFEEKNYSPATWVSKKPFDLKRAKPNLTPSGGSDQYIRVNDALAKSDNYAAVRIGNLIGPETFVYYAQQAGVTNPIPPYQSSYLGACDLTVAEVAGIYAALINSGTWEKPFIVKRVQDENGRTIFEHQQEERRVFSPQVARQVVGMMENVVNKGTGSSLRSRYGFKFPAAGKTGTTNNYKDAWFVAGTSSLVAAVWVGFDRPKTISSAGYGSAAALPIWAKVFNVAKDHYPMERFPVPAGLERTTLSKGSSWFSDNKTPTQVVYLKPDQQWQISAGAKDSVKGEKPKGFFESLFGW